MELTEICLLWFFLLFFLYLGYSRWYKMRDLQFIGWLEPGEYDLYFHKKTARFYAEIEGNFILLPAEINVKNGIDIELEGNTFKIQIDK